MSKVIQVDLKTISQNGETVPNKNDASFKLDRETCKRLTVLPKSLLDDHPCPHFTTFVEVPDKTPEQVHRAVAMLAKGENVKRISDDRNYNALYFVEFGDEWIAFLYRECIDEDGNIIPWHSEFFRLSEKALRIVHRYY